MPWEEPHRRTGHLHRERRGHRNQTSFSYENFAAGVAVPNDRDLLRRCDAITSFSRIGDKRPVHKTTLAGNLFGRKQPRVTRANGTGFASMSQSRSVALATDSKRILIETPMTYRTLFLPAIPESPSQYFQAARHTFLQCTFPANAPPVICNAPQ